MTPEQVAAIRQQAAVVHAQAVATAASAAALLTALPNVQEPAEAKPERPRTLGDE